MVDVSAAQTAVLMYRVMFYGAELWVLAADVGFYYILLKRQH